MRMTETMSRVTLHITVACCVLAGCATDEPDAEAVATDGVAADSLMADSVFAPVEDRATLPTSRIYYTLTSHEWYARGEPLLHDGRPHAPDGMPVHASLTEMTRAGEYQGVEYYVHAADTGAAVYVPVFDGYWQRFRADASAAAAPAGGVPVDSTTATD